MSFNTEFEYGSDSHNNNKNLNENFELDYEEFNDLNRNDLDFSFQSNELDIKDNSKCFPAKRQRIKESSRLLPQNAIDIMTQWYIEHYTNPYPSFSDFNKLSHEGQISVGQVKQWFANARRRTQNEYRRRRIRSDSTKKKNSSDEYSGGSAESNYSDNHMNVNYEFKDSDQGQLQASNTQNYTNYENPNYNQYNQYNNYSTSSYYNTPSSYHDYNFEAPYSDDQPVAAPTPTATILAPYSSRCYSNILHAPDNNIAPTNRHLAHPNFNLNCYDFSYYNNNTCSSDSYFSPT